MPITFSLVDQNQQFLAKPSTDRPRSSLFQIFDISVDVWDIRGKTQKLCEIAPNLWSFSPPNFLGCGLPEILYISGALAGYNFTSPRLLKQSSQDLFRLTRKESL